MIGWIVLGVVAVPTLSDTDSYPAWWEGLR